MTHNHLSGKTEAVEIYEGHLIERDHLGFYTNSTAIASQYGDTIEEVRQHIDKVLDAGNQYVWASRNR